MRRRVPPTDAHDAPPRAPGGDHGTRSAAVNDTRLHTSGPPLRAAGRGYGAAWSGSASSSQHKGAHTVIGEGKVIAVVPASREIVLTHGEIKGFMNAMTMGYAIQPASLLEGVRAGDTVRFTIDTEQKAIVTLEKLQP